MTILMITLMIFQLALWVFVIDVDQRAKDLGLALDRVQRTLDRVEEECKTVQKEHWAFEDQLRSLQLHDRINAVEAWMKFEKGLGVGGRNEF